MSPALHSLHLTFLTDQARLPSVARLFLAAAVIATKWDRYYKTRRVLKDLEPHLLKDIGVTQYEAQSEGAKRFWQE